MFYPEVIKYLESFIDYEKLDSYLYKDSIKLDRIKGLLTLLGNPQDKFRCIHIAGTKGKGSTCAFIAYILRQAGYKVGLYTSPHLSDFRERIRILSLDSQALSTQTSLEFEGMISKERIIKLIAKIEPVVEKYNQDIKEDPLTFFELYTALAFLYFYEEKIDFAVLETGMGGRLDATNVVWPLVCGITPISYEHTQKLGSTLCEIAQEKAGIIKDNNSVVVSAPQEKEAGNVLLTKCKEKGVKFYEIGRNIFFEKISSNQEEQIFNLHTISSEYSHLRIRLHGEYQVINASLAISVIEALRAHEIFIQLDALRAGLYNTIWPGRFEVIHRDPLVIVDGAQNVASSCVLKEAINRDFTHRKLILVIGFSKDKDITGSCEVLFPLAEAIILTKSSNPRAASPGLIKDKAKDCKESKHLVLTQDIEEAIKLAKRRAKKDDLIVITGSLFLVGEARQIITKDQR